MSDQSPRLSDLLADLSAPFPMEQIEIKPGAVSEQKKRALALAYVDARFYQSRLDSVIGPDNWSVEYRPVSDRAILCRLSLLGIVREDVGEAPEGDQNQATSAAMQAFKRACAAFGLGRYLYTDLPQIWAEVEPMGRSWKFTDPRGVVATMYDSAGISLDRRGQYLSRIRVLLDGMGESALLDLGKSLAKNGK